MSEITQRIIIRSILADIFENHEALEKIHVEIYPQTRNVKIKIEDLDDEWFGELQEAGAQIFIEGSLQPVKPIRGIWPEDLLQ